jgi:hypothetical protein
MIPRFIALAFGVAALALAGCADIGSSNVFGGAPPKPKTVLVADFVAAPEVGAIDRGFSVRMDRKGSNFPILERKRRTLARVNDELVATIVATLREAGLDAEPGSEEALTIADAAAVVSGRLRGAEPATAKNKQIGFGPGHSGVVANITVSYVSNGARKQLLTFSAEAKDAANLPTGKAAAAFNAEIAAALTAEKAAPEKLSPDVEGQARRLGRAAGEKVVGYAKAQGWIAAPEAAAAEPAEPAEKPVRMPPPRPEAKPAT